MNLKSYEKMGCMSDPLHVHQILKLEQPNKPGTVMSVINVNQRTIRIYLYKCI